MITDRDAEPLEFVGLPASEQPRAAGMCSQVRRFLGPIIAHHQVVLVMLSLAGIGWLSEARFGLVEWYYQVTREYETLHAAGLIPCVLMVLWGAFLDTYRAHQHVLRERERIRAQMHMALRAAQEINDPLALVIANLEMVVPPLHPTSQLYFQLQPVREAAWTILDRVRELTAIACLPRRETAALPSLITAVDGRPLSTIWGELDRGIAPPSGSNGHPHRELGRAHSVVAIPSIWQRDTR
jgi:hypothetical protein